MKIKRRDFLKGVAGGAALSIVPQGLVGAESTGRAPGQIGILYDATLCIGCQVCMSACKKANNMPLEQNGPLKVWENPLDLSSKTLNIIKKYENGTREKKDSAINGFSFIKRQCLHCVDPACVSVCPASAMKKDPKTGIVTYDKDACIGCRYCQVACQFNIPKFEWDDPFPQIVKCQMCSHLIAKGDIPACCGECPTGASLFGPVSDLMTEVKRRKKLIPGNHYEYPVASLTSGKTAVHRATKYFDHIYGEKESGGTQVILMSGVPFDLLGLPTLPDKSYTSISENIQHTIYKGMLLPIALLGGLIFLIAKNTKDDK